jgi:hypothetical protein
MSDRDIMFYLAGIVTMCFLRWFRGFIRLVNDVDKITTQQVIDSRQGRL